MNIKTFTQRLDSAVQTVEHFELKFFLGQKDIFM